MELTSELIEITVGKAKVSLRADLLDGQFKDVSLGIMYYDGKMQDGYIALTPYGLTHTNNGEHKDAIDKVLKKVQGKIASDYGITFSEPPSEDDDDITDIQEEEES